MFFVCSFALAMLAVTTQQNVKADTTTEASVENVQQPVAQATQEVSAPEETATQTADQNQTETQATDQTQTPVVNDATTADAQQAAETKTQADSTTSNITQIKGVVTTGNQITYLYTQDGQKLTNRALGPNTPWYTDQRMAYNGGTYYRVATNEFADGQNVTLSYGSAADGIVRVQPYGAVNYTRNDTGFARSGQPNFDGNSVWKYNRTDNANGKTFYQIASNVWINSDDATTAPAYQNPNGWLQIHD